MKKNLAYILIIAIGLTAFIAFIAPHLAHADEGEGGHSVGWLGSQILGAKTLEEFAAKVGNLILTLCIYILSLCAKLFDAVITEAINQTSSFIKASGVVPIGWQLCRDIANVFFVFVIIFIGFATILQLPNYNYKRLLLKVIVVALLINFSLFFAQTIIDVSNELALVFYNQIHNPSTDLELSDVFAGGVKIQTLYDTKGTGLEQAVKSNQLTFTKIAIITILGSALILISAFVLLAGAILFILRTITLSILMILAPLAFVGMILPKTAAIANKWWDQLISQAFLAPAFLFMFYLTALTINKAQLGTVYSGTTGKLAEALANPASASGGNDDIKLIIQFITVILLMLGCLAVAKFMGGKAGSLSVSGAHWVKNKSLGYAGKISRGTGRFAGRQAMKVGEKAVYREGKEGREERKWVSRLQTISPRIGGKIAEQLRKAPMSFGRKESVEALVRRGMQLPPQERAKYLEKLGKGFFRDKQAQKEMFEQMSARERVELIEKSPSFKPIYNNLLNTLKTEEREKTEKLEKERAFANKIDRLGSKQNPLSQSEMEDLLKTIKGDQIKDVAKGGGAAADEFFEKLKTFGSTVDEISNKLASMGNKDLASWMHSTAAKGWLKVYNIAEKGEKPKLAGPGEFKQALKEARKRGERFG